MNYEMTFYLRSLIVSLKAILLPILPLFLLGFYGVRTYWLVQQEHYWFSLVLISFALVLFNSLFFHKTVEESSYAYGSSFLFWIVYFVSFVQGVSHMVERGIGWGCSGWGISYVVFLACFFSMMALLFTELADPVLTMDDRFVFESVLLMSVFYLDFVIRDGSFLGGALLTGIVFCWMQHGYIHAVFGGEYVKTFTKEGYEGIKTAGEKIPPKPRKVISVGIVVFIASAGSFEYGQRAYGSYLEHQKSLLENKLLSQKGTHNEVAFQTEQNHVKEKFQAEQNHSEALFQAEMSRIQAEQNHSEALFQIEMSRSERELRLLDLRIQQEGLGTAQSFQTNSPTELPNPTVEPERVSPPIFDPRAALEKSLKELVGNPRTSNSVNQTSRNE